MFGLPEEGLVSNLYELMGDYTALQAAMDDQELTDAQLQELLDAVDETKGPLREKIDNICRLLANIGGDVEKYKVEEGRLERRRRTLENKHKRIRDWVRSSMDILEVDNMKTTVHAVTLGKAGKIVEVKDVKLIPDDYVKIERKPKKKEIMKAYKDDGVIVDGCEIVDGERKLTIR